MGCVNYLSPSSAENMRTINSVCKIKLHHLVEVIQKDAQFAPAGQDFNYECRRLGTIKEIIRRKDEDKRKDENL